MMAARAMIPRIAIGFIIGLARIFTMVVTPRVRLKSLTCYSLNDLGRLVSRSARPCPGISRGPGAEARIGVGVDAKFVAGHRPGRNGTWSIGRSVHRAGWGELDEILRRDGHGPAADLVAVFGHLDDAEGAE